MSFRTEEINYSELIPIDGIVTPKNISKIFSPYYLKYGLGINDTNLTEAGIKVYKLNGIKGSVYENKKIKYLGNKTWSLVASESVFKRLLERN